MKFNRISLLFVLVAFIVGGCASPGLPKKEYYNRLLKIELGLSKSEFKQIFPESIPRGAKKYPKGTVEVMEVSYEYYSFFPTNDGMGSNLYS